MTEITNRPPFKVQGIASIKHINVRKEGPEDDKVLAVDVKLTFKQVDRRLCDYFDDALQAFLWRGETESLIVRNPFLSPVTYGNSINSADVQIGVHKFAGCDVRKFSIEPADGGVITLTCSVSLYPSAGEVSDLAKLVQDDDRVSIEGPPDLFDHETTPSAAQIEPASDDELYPKAAEIVLKDRKASISYLQRKLVTGYNCAARLLERMEQSGLVSRMDASGRRQVLAEIEA